MSTFIGIGANKIVDETTILLNTLKNEKADLESQVKELTEKSDKKNQKNSDNSEE